MFIYIYYYVSLNRTYLNIFFMGIYLCVYLNILTLFFYKCVCSRQTQEPVTLLSFMEGELVKGHEPGMATAITTLR